VRSGRGFTLLEILVVVMIVGILTAIAIPKFGATRKEAYVVAMKSDLRNLLIAQEAYYHDYSVYTTTLSTRLFKTTSGVTVAIARVAAGWKATANHSKAPGKPCYIMGGGNTTANNLATVEGEVKCTP
jgi:prepilin-type N-terminal cleavage/methylation domain-containing protein